MTSYLQFHNSYIHKMNPVFRGVAIYLFMYGLSDHGVNEPYPIPRHSNSIFSFIVSEVTQQALVGKDFSLTGSAILIGTLMSMDLVSFQVERQF